MNFGGDVEHGKARSD